VVEGDDQVTREEVLNLLLDIKNITNKSGYDIFVLTDNLNEFIDNALKEI
jgi:hypothetical protein